MVIMLSMVGKEQQTKTLLTAYTGKVRDLQEALRKKGF